MTRLEIYVETDRARPDARVALVLQVDPPLPDGPALGALYLPAEWVKVLKAVAPALAVLGGELDLEVVWTGAPVDVAPDPKLAKAARLLKKTVGLLT